jgi:hypothetical protein
MVGFLFCLEARVASYIKQKGVELEADVDSDGEEMVKFNGGRAFDC